MGRDRCLLWGRQGWCAPLRLLDSGKEGSDHCVSTYQPGTEGAVLNLNGNQQGLLQRLSDMEDLLFSVKLRLLADTALTAPKTFEGRVVNSLAARGH